MVSCMMLLQMTKLGARGARIAWLLMIGLAATAPVGCGVSNRYVLPVSSGEADLYYPAIMSASQEMGVQPYLTNNGVQVRLKEGGWIYFMAQGRPTLEMIVAVPDQPDVQERQRAGKQLGDAIWNRAMALRRAAGP
jgi:hypothetical protein